MCVHIYSSQHLKWIKKSLTRKHLVFRFMTTLTKRFDPLQMLITDIYTHTYTYIYRNFYKNIKESYWFQNLWTAVCVCLSLSLTHTHTHTQAHICADALYLNINVYFESVKVMSASESIQHPTFVTVIKKVFFFPHTWVNLVQHSWSTHFVLFMCMLF